MSTFKTTTNVESHEELLGDTKIYEEEKRVEDGEFSESFITEFEEKIKKQIVKDEEEAYNIYCQYAHSKGFSVRKDKQYYFQGSLVVREKRFVCYRHGEKDERQRKSSKASCTHIDTRSNCPAMISFKRQLPKSPFMIDRFVTEHNHEMASPKKRHLLRSARSITKTKGLVIENMVSAGIKPTATYSYLTEEAGGADVLGYSKKDCFNFIHQLMKSKVEAGDAQSVVNEFNNKQVNDALFYWDVQLDSEGRITNFFWRDGRSRINYEFFGDVVSFDTTYRTNKYRMICAPFIGINHHWQNMIFGCAFLSDESTESFKWLFSTFLKSMGGITPQTFITDQARAMAAAIREVMPSTRHRLCQWHIAQNAPSHLGSLKNNKGFLKLFNKCMSECDSIIEFEESWKMILTTYNVEEHRWLNNLYNIRHMWSTAFNNDVFSAGLKATSRSESTNHVLNGIGDLNTYLHIFVTNYEKNVVTKWRMNEEHEDFNCKQGKPTLAVKHSPILAQVSTIYTHKIYNIFEKEFLKGAGACFIETQVYCDDQVSKYEVKMHSSSKSWFVELNPTTLHVTCTCKKFEYMGILCAHCLLILTSNKVRAIPDEYILKRWTKDVRKRIKNLSSKSYTVNESSESEIVYTNNVMQTCYNLSHLSKSNGECREIFQRHLENASLELDDYLGKLPNTFLHNSAKNGMKNIEVEVLDPLHVKAPGVRKDRIQRHWDKPKKRKTTQPTCEKTKKSPEVVAPSTEKLFEDNTYTPCQATSPLLEVNLQDDAFDFDVDESNISLLTLLQSVENTSRQSYSTSTSENKYN